MVNKIITSGQRSLKSKSFIKQTPKKWELSFKIHFPNFQKPKIKLKNGPLKFKKIKTYIRRPQIKKFYKADPKSGNSDLKYNFEIFKNQKSN